MRILARFGLVLAVGALFGAVLSSTAFAGGPLDAGKVAFVQTDNPAGNQIVAYDRGSDGTLSQAGVYATGGLGGILAGSASDHTASQGALAYDAGSRELYAVNAGSNSVSVFAVRGDRLSLVQVVPSGGSFPVSIAVGHRVIYVLNALHGGSVQGFARFFGRLLPLPQSSRPLGLDPNATPQFVNTPGQVAFSPDESKLIVTTKANGSDIDVFSVGFLGYLSAAPVVNSEPGAVPFAISFDASNNLVIAEAGTNSLVTFTLNADGTVTPISSAATGGAATCWVARSGSTFFASNTGSGNVTSVASGPGGQLTFLGNTPTDAGTIDAAASPDGHYLYVQTGIAGNVDEFVINSDGSLTSIGFVNVPGAAGGEGIVVL